MQQYIVTGRVADGNFTPFCATVNANSEAETAEEAYNKWSEGDYGTIPDVNDEDIIGNYVEVDGETYYLNRFEKVTSGYPRQSNRNRPAIVRFDRTLGGRE